LKEVVQGYDHPIPKWISIIGCGNLGSALAYMIMLRSLNKDTEVKQLCLVDNDILEPKNLPYLFNIDEDYLYKPKVNVLDNILSASKIDIRAYNSTYPNLDNLEEDDINEVYDTYMIDCRDTSSEVSACSMKLNIDGSYGVINLNPIDSKKTKTSRYTIENSKYYAMLFAGICCQIIFQDIKLKDDKTIIDLTKGEKHGVLSKREGSS
jgi:hypothetical protein